MGQKVNPIGYRLGVNRDWRSRWYASPQELPAFLHNDIQIRDYVKKKLQFAAVSKIVIERAWNSIRVTIHTARPGIVIGRKGAEIEKMTEEISRMSDGKSVKIDIQEIKTPELDAQLVAENVALQIERRIASRRAMKKAIQIAMDFGAEGIRLRCAGRLGGAEISRAEWYREGKIPLHTLRDADRLRFRRSEHRLRKNRSQMLDLQEGRSACRPGRRSHGPAGSRVRGLTNLPNERDCHAFDAQTSEVSQVPARQPQGDGFTQSPNRLRRVRVSRRLSAPGSPISRSKPPVSRSPAT